MESVRDKSRTKEIIGKLFEIMNNASPVPLSAGKVSVYKEEVQSLLTELSSQMDIEIKTYHEVNDRKGKIIAEAKKEAEKIIYQAEHTASRMRVSKRATDVAPINYEMLTEEEKAELANANEIYKASLIYTDEMLMEVRNIIADSFDRLQSDYDIITSTLKERLETLDGNRKELMDGLVDMGDEERSQQIMEIGQLLSNELYESRRLAKTRPDLYDDEAIQAGLDIQKENDEKAREAETKAHLTAVALAQVTAERDALAAKVNKLETEGAKTVNAAGVAKAVKTDYAQDEEVMYVSEDELLPGEEYEVEYVDDEEYEDLVNRGLVQEEDPETDALLGGTKITGRELDDIDVNGDELDDIDVRGDELDNLAVSDEKLSDFDPVSNIEKSEKVASVKDTDLDKVAGNDNKKKGFIESAVMQREKDEEILVVEGNEGILDTTHEDDGNEPPKREKSVAEAIGAVGTIPTVGTLAAKKSESADSKKEEPGASKKEEAKNNTSEASNDDDSSKGRRKKRRRRRQESERTVKKDADIKKDSKGNEYIEAKMGFDDSPKSR